MLQLRTMLLLLIVWTSAVQGTGAWHLWGNSRRLLEVSARPKSTTPHIPLPPPLYLLALGNITAQNALKSEAGVPPFHAAARRRCRQTKGRWCGLMERQQPLAWKPTPRGDKQCPGDCSGVGNCNYDTGECECPAGWGGKDCAAPLKRACTKSLTPENGTRFDAPASFVNASGFDLDMEAPGWTASRCPGVCDDDIGACYCGWGKYRRIPAPPGSPPGTPPIQRGRPLELSCRPNHVPAKNGSGLVKIDWGFHSTDWDAVYGENGWCNADQPKRICGCMLDGIVGSMCDGFAEQFCLNQCSGHGECLVGFCRCHAGWYGTDCSRKRAGLDMEPGLLENGTRPWLKRVVAISRAALQFGQAAAAGQDLDGDSGTQQRGWQQQSGAGAAVAATGMTGASSAKGALRQLLDAAMASSSRPRQQQQQRPAPRLRPLIYVYDMPPAYTTRMLQYRIGPIDSCVYRHYTEGNDTSLSSMAYTLETYLHEMLLQSPHRTFDPEEADFFYVPMYVSCYFWPVLGWADYPWWYAPFTFNRPMHGAQMMMEALQWIKTSHARWWDRRGGRDHIWLATHDEASCYVPSAIANTSIILTHWGRMDPHHKSNTAHGPDNYSEVIPPVFKGFQQGLAYEDHRLLYADGRPCYNPRKDLLLPVFKSPSHYAMSPLLGHPPMERDILLFFRGDVGLHRTPRYSRGIRQSLHRLAQEGQWHIKHRIYIGTGGQIGGDYSQQLARSKYCLVAPGDGFSTRAEDAVLHGCVPVLVMDNVHATWESILDWDQWSVRVREASLQHLPHILESIPDDKLRRMQRRVRFVWHRFAWASGPLMHEWVQRYVKTGRDKAEVLKGEQMAMQRDAASNSTLSPGSTWSGNLTDDNIPNHLCPHCMVWREGGQWPPRSPSEWESPSPEPASALFTDDALATLLQWLYSRMPEVHRSSGSS